MRDATDIAAAVRSGEASAVEVTRDHLSELAARDREVASVWLVTEERALREAAAVDERIAAGEDPGLLAGVPVGWKDLIDTAGERTTYGGAIWRDNVPSADADVVARTVAAGGTTVAKLATHELAWGTTSDNPHFGTCHNPHDHARVPGGSSGGSGAALASGIVALAPGTDTGGSIRCPASCCGVVGLKPTFGRVSLSGVHPLCMSLDHCGPMARSVRDCALMLEVLAGPSPADPRTPPVPVERYRDALGRGVEGMRIGVAERYFFEHTEPGVVTPVRAALEALQEAGGLLVEVDLGWAESGITQDIYLAEEAATLAGYWPQRRADLGADVVAAMEAAERTEVIEVARQQLVRLDYRTELERRIRAAGIDLIATPTQAFTPPLIGTQRVAFAGNSSVDVTVAMCGLTEIFNITGWPAISVPCGIDPLGMPVGIQLAALPWREADCLAAAAVLTT
jgi:aspartyl-tRNA(Asn)/glutamyl-tRNA(Gln) amidotransferase subunit A